MGSTITAIVGSNGDGKTLGAVAMYVSKALAKDRPVWATFDILDPKTGERHANTHKLNTWHQLLELHDCLLVLDEINSEFPSRGAMQLPAELMSLIHQLRKPRVDLVWTAVNWARADVALREATKIVITAKGFMPDKWLRESGVAGLRHPSGNKLRDDKGHAMKLNEEWPPMRLFRYLSYDASTFDEFTIHAVKDIKPLKRRWYWRPWHDHAYMYSTHETVPLLDNVSATGTCIRCGGQRQRLVCHCTTAAPARAEARRVTAAGETVA